MTGRESGRTVWRLVAAGVGAWFAIAVVVMAWLLAAAREPGPTAAAVPFYAWASGWPAGGSLMLIVAGIGLVRRWVTVRSALAAALVYFAPPLAAFAAFRGFLAAQPLTTAESGLATMIAAVGGPTFFGLAVVGLVAGARLRDRSLPATAVALATPSCLGVAGAVVFFVAFTVGSPAWRHRADAEGVVRAGTGHRDV